MGTDNLTLKRVLACSLSRPSHYHHWLILLGFWKHYERSCVLIVQAYIRVLAASVDARREGKLPSDAA